MKFKSTRIALILFLAMAVSGGAFAQNALSFNASQPAQVLFVPPQLTDFERYASNTDQPLVHVAFPPISADLGPHLTLVLTPRGLTAFNTPGALKATAVELNLTQSLAAGRNTQLSPLHSVATLLDFDEMLAFRSVFHALAATGMPQPPFPDVKAVVRMTSKGGLRLEFEAQTDGQIRCMVSTDADSVVLLLDADSASKWADAFTAAFRTLDAARESKT